MVQTLHLRVLTNKLKNAIINCKERFAERLCKPYFSGVNTMKMSSNDYQESIKNIKATFAIEGMRISDVSISNIKRLANGSSTCKEIVSEIKQKYTKNGDL